MTIGLPCENTACKSYGKPHPNCRCHGGLAEGGEVAFCSKDREHQAGCEYFADGGLAIDPDKVVIDQPSEPEEAPAAAPETATEIPEDQVVIDKPTSRYETTGQQMGTVAEGIAHGVAGPLATGAELGLSALGVPGMTAEDQAARQLANPSEYGASEIAGLGGSMLLGVGEAGLLAKGAEAAANYARLGKVGAGILQGALSSGVIQAGDEASKWMLGQGDPQDAAAASLAHTGIATVLGGALGGLGAKTANLAKSGLTKLAESQLGQKSEYFLYGLAAASKGEATMEGLDKLPAVAKSGYKMGMRAFDALTSKIAPPTLGAAAEGWAGYKEDGAAGAVKGIGNGILHGLLFDLVGKGVGYFGSKVAAPTILKVLSSGNLTGITGALDHAANVAAGSKALESAVNAVCSSTPIAGQQALNDFYSEKDRSKLDDYIGNGGINQDVKEHIYNANDPVQPQGYAKGGRVERSEGSSPIVKDDDGIAMHYPEQNIALNTAKGRVSNYLSSLRPQEHQPRLAFDDQPDQREQKKTYHRALDLAVKPLGIMEEIRKGTISPEHVMHMNAMYPEVTGLLQKKLTEKIVQMQMDGKKPPYKVRQGLSLMMGTALSGEMLPQNIQAAQSVFALAKTQRDPSQSPTKIQKNTSKLTKADQAYLSGTQAREQRAQKS